MQRLHPLARRALLRDLNDNPLTDAQLRAGLLRKVEPFDQQVRPSLEPWHRRTARLSGRSPVTGFDEHDPVLAQGSGFACPAEIAFNALSFDQLCPFKDLHRPERPVMPSDAGDPPHLAEL